MEENKLHFHQCSKREMIGCCSSLQWTSHHLCNHERKQVKDYTIFLLQKHDKTVKHLFKIKS